ncbi:MAG: T9SS type A sorting domain-containing protein [Bacteroidales bacterium]|nr:T9SS type A sorting domain-containing protein [Bacteroidales bacterium]
MKKIFITSGLMLLIICLYSQSNLISKDVFGNTPHSYPAKINSLLGENQKAGNEWTSVGPYGGDVYGIAVNPQNTDVVFAGAGFPYISFNGGNSWEIIDELLNLASGGIDVFEATADGVIYAGGYTTYGKIFRSSDGGNTWQQLNFSLTRGVYDIVVDPNDQNIIYLGVSADPGPSSNVVVVSYDGGDSWTPLNLINALPVGFSVVDLSIDPENSQTIFAVGNESFSNALIAASFDGGQTWEDRSSNLPTGKPYNVVTIAGQTVYVGGGQLFGGNYMGLYKSTDYGLSWQNISTSFPNKVISDILIDPDNSDKMYLATEGDGIYYTLNGGTTWNYNTTGAGDEGSARCLVFEPGNTDVIYSGFLSLASCKSTDAGQSWSYANIGIATLLLNDIEVDINNSDIVITGFEAENSGGCYLSNNGGNTWELVAGLPGTRFSKVTFGSDGTLYVWSNGPSSVAQEGLYKSIDGGITWENMGPNIGSLFETEIFAIAASLTNPDLIFIGGNNFGVNGFESIIYRTTDGGENWEEVFTGPEWDSFNYLFIDPNSNDEIIYAAYMSNNAQGGFLKSIDGGTGWLPINSGIPASTKWVGAIVCDPINPDILYGGIGGYSGTGGSIYKSEDGGMLWTPTNISLGVWCKIMDIFISPLNEDVIYTATTQNGVYITTNAGDTWEAANDGLPANRITSFSESFSVNDTLKFFASSFTNSAFITDVYVLVIPSVDNTKPLSELISIYPNPSSGKVYINLGINKDKDIRITITNIAGQVIESFEYFSKDKGINKLELELNLGVYFCNIFSNGNVVTKKIIILK